MIFHEQLPIDAADLDQVHKALDQCGEGPTALLVIALHDGRTGLCVRNNATGEMVPMILDKQGTRELIAMLEGTMHNTSDD